ncbi:DUF1778 domain-containing protein [Rugamonas sp.]|uniref:type II toxin-antitoxin system TacA family antitoxin n=1 Tax=Rugamonas sp. TaxID=1926287 RepID=UPI0025F79928|nr:DUF1778 domain-containing protein [Rugamonas sp.]
MDTTEGRDRITDGIPSPVLEKLQRAAQQTGATLHQFIVQAALEKADMIIDGDIILYSPADAAMLMDMLDAPGKPNAALLKAFERFKNRMEDGSLHIRVDNDA